MILSAINTMKTMIILGTLLTTQLAVPVDGTHRSYRTGQNIKTIPKFSQIEAVIKLHFDEIRGFRYDGIIVQSEVAPLFNKLKKAGWNISKDDRQAILDRVLPDDSFLAKELRTPAGKKFAADIFKYPDGFDRLDRLSRMPQGRDTVDRLIRGPGGYKMIQYMTTAPGGKNLGKQLSDTPKGGNFNRPTGRIYTAQMLLDELNKLYKDSFQKPNHKKATPKKPVNLQNPD